MVQVGEADPEKKGGARRENTDQVGMGLNTETNGGRGPAKKMSRGQTNQVKEKSRSSGPHSRRLSERCYSVRELINLHRRAKLTE
jgi:hypothetical protein